MEHIKLSIRLPVDLHEPLSGEASGESRSLNQQIVAILKERYKIHAPPVSTTSSQSRALPRARKQKQKAAA